MQNVLVDDRRIWVDLYVLTILVDPTLTSFRAARSPWHGSILPGPITPKWECVAKRKVDLVVETIWRKHGGTELVTKAMAEMAVMEWCSKSLMTKEHRGITADMIERRTLEIVSADARLHLCHATDLGNGAAAERNIIGSVRAAVELIVGGSNMVFVCVYLFQK
jgi:hypothetical protein